MAIVSEKGKNPIFGLISKLGIVAGCSVILYFIAETVVIDFIKFVIRTAVWMLGY